MSIPELDTALGTLVDYDLNIYHLDDRRVLNPEIVAADPEDDANYIYVYSDTWYIDIYEYTTNNGGSNMEHVTGPYELTELEANALRLGTEEWDNDNWYGMWGFLQDYKNLITPRLLEILEGLPKYKNETLF